MTRKTFWILAILLILAVFIVPIMLAMNNSEINTAYDQTMEGDEDDGGDFDIDFDGKKKLKTAAGAGAVAAVAKKKSARSAGGSRSYRSGK